jgi:glutamate/tyrosine decarboxylase-like PLP-dependent enzyme
MAMANNERKDLPHPTSVNAWFLGPKAENAGLVEDMILHILRDYCHWRRNYYPADEILITQRMRREAVDWEDHLFQQISEMVALMKRHFPFYSPRYIAHQLSDQTIPSLLGYFAGLLYNPNNVTPEAAPVTVEWELEVGKDILRLLGYKCPPPPDASPGTARREFGWAHITSGGTVATLEALWVARNVRYFPLAVKYAAQATGVPITVKLPTGDEELYLLSTLDDRQVLALKPNEAIYLLARFVHEVKRHFDLSSTAEASHRAWHLLAETGFSIAHGGVTNCFHTLPPAIFVSGAVHDSVAKAADVLGLGRENVILVDMDRCFRLDVKDLQRKMERCVQKGLYPLAVIAIAGTTEQGAVDPVHEIHDLRRRMERDRGFSFWLHVDAAWGGYLRALFLDPAAEAKQSPRTFSELLEAMERRTRRTLQLQKGHYRQHIPISWSNKQVCSAFLSFPRAESITIDPHKMGYVPYPAGVVAFRNDRVRHFLTQEAPYISVAAHHPQPMYKHEAPTTIGPFILEGSKPGAAAAACWLSHRLIPPNTQGYGELARLSLLGARELHERLVHWEHACRANRLHTNYAFVPLTDQPPDTNIVCFVVKEKGSRSLARLNRLTRLVYDRFSIEVEAEEREYSYAQPFFLSRTTFEAPRYPLSTVQGFLERAEVTLEDYKEHGVFLIRSTVMTPYIVYAAETGRKQEYLADFMEILTQTVRDCLVQLHVSV